MKTPLLAAKIPKKVNTVILDLSFNNTFADASGNYTPVVVGYANGVPTFATLDGRGALRVNEGQGITYTVKAGKERLFNTPNWRLEFSVNLIAPQVVKHETILAFRKASAPADYTMFFWKHYQTGNKMIVTGTDSKSESAPVFVEPTAMVASQWRKYAVEHDGEAKTMKFYVNDVLISTRVNHTTDLSSDILEIIKGTSPNFFNGWIRDLKVIKK